MGLKDIFNNCMLCDRSGLFTKLDKNGHCPQCAQTLLEEKRRKDEEKRIRESSPSFLLNKFTRPYIPRPCMHQGASRAYTYFITLADVDRDTVYRLTQANSYDVAMKIADDGRIALMSGDSPVAYLTDKQAIATDWINKKLPYICQLAEFKDGKERAVLHLFRNEEAKYSKCKVSIAKLTSCASEEKQFNISVLEPGERLFVEEDDDGKWYVRNVDYHELGRLPAKFSKMFDDDTLRAMFFDHTESKENANGDETAIPYVRFYYD